MHNIYDNVVNNVNNRLWKRVFLWVQCRMDLHGVLVLLKDLPKTANTVRYFHAQIKIMMDEQYLQQRSK